MGEFRKIAFVSFLGNFLTGHPKSVNLLLVALVSGGEQLIDSFAFNCPSDPNLAEPMGWFYLLFPPIIVFSITLAVSKQFWFFYHGCYQRGQKAEPKEEDALASHAPFPDANSAKKYEKQLAKRRSAFFWTPFYRTLLLPFIWIVTALFDGDYMVCSFRTGGNAEQIKDTSRLVAWLVLLVLTLIGAAGMCCIRCCDKVTFLQNLYEDTYMRKYQKEVKPKAKKKAKQDVKVAVAELGIVLEPEKEESGVQEPGNSEKKSENSLVKSLKKKINSLGRKEPESLPATSPLLESSTPGSSGGNDNARNDRNDVSV